MSRTEPMKDVLNLSSSTISYSDDSDEIIEDVDIDKILSEETTRYDVLDALPPTPQCPVTRSQSRLSVSSAASSFPATPQKKSNPSKKLKSVPPIETLKVNNDGAGAKSSGAGAKSSGAGAKSSGAGAKSSGAGARSGGAGKRRIRRKRTDKEICDELGIKVDESELQEIEEEGDNDNDNRVRVDNIIEDLLDLGLGKTRAPRGGKSVTVEEENLHRQFAKLRTNVPLEINGDGRCSVLKEDVTTVKKTLESMTALISILEKTRDKLINADKDLVFTPPPVVEKKKSKLPHNSQKKS